MSSKKYKVLIANSGKEDVKQKKLYILQQFQYREYANNFSQKIKQAVKMLDTMPTSHTDTGLQYRGYNIYMLPQNEHLLFYTVNEAKLEVTVLRVLQDGRDWQFIINQWIRENTQNSHAVYTPSDR